jgi:hypothetical protein
MFGVNLIFKEKVKIILLLSLFSEEYQFALMPITRLLPHFCRILFIFPKIFVFSAGLVFLIRFMSIYLAIDYPHQDPIG